MRLNVITRMGHARKRHSPPLILNRASLMHVARLLLLVCALAPSVRPQTQPPAKETKDAGTVAGRVTRDGRGVGEVLITLLPEGGAKAVARATSDADGNYRLTNVPPGRYFLNPFAPAFVISGVNQAAWQPGRMLNVVANDKLEGIDFMLVRGGVVTGRVTHADGRPLVEGMVRVMPAEEAERKRPLYDMNPFTFQTDDRGVYRLYGLPPGRYLVYVGEDPEDGMVRSGGGSVPRTFYGNTQDMTQARPVEVTPGEEVAGIDITAARAPRGYEATGRVLDERGQPIAGAHLIYGPLNATENRFMGAFGGDSAPTNERGEFRLRSLGPGRYGLWAVLGQPFREEQGAEYSDVLSFEIGEQDVSGLELKLRRGATLSGVVTVEGPQSPAVLAKLGELRLGTDSRTPGSLMPPFGPRVRVNGDGSFGLTGLRPGRIGLHLSWPQVRGFTLLRVLRDGLEQPEGIEVTGQEQITGVRVVVAYGVAAIRGQVQFPAGRPEGRGVHVEALRAGATPGSGGGYADIDALGRFVLENLAAGEYEVVLFEDYPRTGTDKRRPPVDRKVVNVPESGEVQVTLVFKGGAQP
jgi:protocatechuate 3,4-dioxygenase beta subunit